MRTKKLPEDRSKIEDTEFGFPVPKVIPEGKCTLKTALTFISEHSSTPTKVTAETIAKEYSLNKVDVENVLKHFQMYHVQLPKDPTKYASDVAPPKSLDEEEVKKIRGEMDDKK